MKIQQIKVNNFKSLVNFELSLIHFNCLVGLNGAGKSTLLQFFDFLSQLVKGDIKGWLEKRHWSKSDLNSKLIAKQNIDFTVLLHQADQFQINWTASFNYRTLRCTVESIHWDNNLIFAVKNGKYQINAVNQQSAKDFKIIDFDYQGSLISQLKESQLTPEILAFKTFFKGLHTLDLLAPTLLKTPIRQASENSLGLGGEGLSAFLYHLEQPERALIQAKLAKAYPALKQFQISQMRTGLKKLMVQEQFQAATLAIEARHLADGFLRLLAIFAQLSKQQHFLLLDEIENGINPELIEILIDTLTQAQPQIMMTTHSPIVLNYLEDDLAIKGVIYLYKKPNGATQAIHLFDLPSLRQKLTVMGPGEVYDDTLLTQLVEEIAQCTGGA